MSKEWILRAGCFLAGMLVMGIIIALADRNNDDEGIF